MKYSVSKQYAHFVQIWEVDANSKEEAWQKAESHGKLRYETVYREVYPLRNYVTSMDDSKKDALPQSLYDEWLQEAIDLGMQHKGNLNIPFSD